MNWKKVLLSQREHLKNKKILCGFDGFVDAAVRPIAPETNKPFQTIAAFGERLAGNCGTNCSFALEADAPTMGGNAPFVANAIARLGCLVRCVGMMGVPGNIHPLFRAMPCPIYSFAPPVPTTCLEFGDGKVLLCQEGHVPDAWDAILKATAGEAPQYCAEADLLALVNFSELSFSAEVWGHVLASIQDTGCDKARIAFFDLCDVSRKSDAEIRAVLQLAGNFTRHRTTILSLNRNEAQHLGRILQLPETASFEAIAHALAHAYKLDEIIIHTPAVSILYTQGSCYKAAVTPVEQPKRLTGAGDHFNAASCVAALAALAPRERLQFANFFAAQFIATGQCPALDML